MTALNSGWSMNGKVCCTARVRPRVNCNSDSALTLGALRACWAGLDDRTPILVHQDASSAFWVQHGDVITRSGLTVVRLLAPLAEQSHPAPGTLWNPATTLRCTTTTTAYANEPGS